MRHSNEESLENYVATTKKLFSSTTKDAILSFDIASLDTSVKEILQNDGVIYVRIFDSNNRLLSSGGKKKTPQ